MSFTDKLLEYAQNARAIVAGLGEENLSKLSPEDQDMLTRHILGYHLAVDSYDHLFHTLPARDPKTVIQLETAMMILRGYVLQVAKLLSGANIRFNMDLLTDLLHEQIAFSGRTAVLQLTMPYIHKEEEGWFTRARSVTAPPPKDPDDPEITSIKLLGGETLEISTFPEDEE